MADLHEQLSKQFYEWEQRGRGWQVFPEPVVPEPPFRPLNGYQATPQADDTSRPTVFSSLFQRFARTLSTEAKTPPPIPEPEEEPEPELLIRDQLVELQTSLPAKLDISKEAFEQFLLSLSHCHEPIGFELLGAAGRVTAQFATHSSDTRLVHRQLEAYFPEAAFQSRESTLEHDWDACEGDDVLIFEFGLAREFFLPLASGKLDPFVGLIGALSELQPGELGLFQVLFQKVKQPWAESIDRSVSHADGKPLFVNAPELTAAANNKIARPLFAAVVRIALRTESQDRTLQLVRDVAGSLSVFSHPQGNELVPLSNEDYLFESHIEDVLRRQSRRSGMLLNSDELIGFVHLPSSAVRSQVFVRETGKSRPAPIMVQQTEGVLFGYNVHAGKSIPIRLTPDQRSQHAHILGVQGTGKSTLLLNLIRQTIESGGGIAVLDPHGDLVDRVLGLIPPERIDDVVLVDPSDEHYSVGFNILAAHSELEKNLLASDLVSMFQRLSTSWGDQMDSVFRNAVLAFLESTRRGTLHELRRFLIEPAFRADFLTSVQDTNIVYYWQKVFPQLGSNKSIGPIATRLNEFLSRKAISHMLAQPENRLDFGGIMDTGKIFLAKLSKGLLGDKDSYLLGTLLVSKFQQLAMARQAQAASARQDFTLVIDEFADFITPTMAQILTGARKYRLGLVLAHQELRQLQRDAEVASAVLANPFTRICFRVGDEDARKLSDGFSHFEARDLQNLSRGEAIMRVERSDYDFNLTVPLFDEPSPAECAERRQAVIAASRAKYARPRPEIEVVLRQMIATEPPAEKAAPKPKVVAKETPAPIPQPPVETSAPAVAPPAETPAPVFTPKVEVAVVALSKAEIVTPPPPAPVTVSPEPKPVTVSEKKTVTADLGRGGAQHKAIQQRIKQAAEALGFRSTIEKQIEGSKQSVDLFLERSDQTIACEISLSTTIDHEVGNIVKCLKAGVAKVAVICLDTRRLEAIAAAVSGSLGNEAATRVVYLQPDQFIADLRHIPPPTPLEPSESTTIRRGYKVKRTLPKLTAEERQQKDDIAVRVISEAMRKKPRK